MCREACLWTPLMMSLGAFQPLHREKERERDENDRSGDLKLERIGKAGSKVRAAGLGNLGTP